MDKPPSPSCSRSSLFLVGRNSRGNWVVQDQKGLCGGLFVDRAEAVKFAMFENGHRPQAVIMVPGILELDMSGKPGASDQVDAQPALARAASPARGLARVSREIMGYLIGKLAKTGSERWSRRSLKIGRTASLRWCSDHRSPAAS